MNPDPRLAELEAEIMRTVNTLGVGTMGFGGKMSLIGCKVGVLNRLPASFFVSVAYDCWAFRRLGVMLDAHDRRDHAVALSRSVGADDPDDGPGRLPAHRPRDRAAARRSTKRPMRSLKVGDVVLDQRPAPTPAATPCTIT